MKPLIAISYQFDCQSSLLPVWSVQPWRSCKGSVPERRGYTCGLWMLFHSLAARVTGPTGGALWMAAVRGFMRRFFQCSDCSKHFEEHGSGAGGAGSLDARRRAAVVVASPQQGEWACECRLRPHQESAIAAYKGLQMPLFGSIHC